MACWRYTGQQVSLWIGRHDNTHLLAGPLVDRVPVHTARMKTLSARVC
jgi:hypothetical protein